MVRQRLLGLVAIAFSFVAGANPVRASGLGQALAIGYPNGGKLVGGQRFHETRHMKALPARASSPAKWALPTLLALLDRASRAVAARYPGSVMLVGELSNRAGGPIASHRSHQNGRDVDVAFYLVNDSGKSFRQSYYIHCDRHGGAVAPEPLRFDLRRNWAFVRALIEDPRANVMHIFVYAPLRAKLLSFAERTGVPELVRQRAALAMSQPMNAEPHDDHFHIRIACPPNQVGLGCVDEARGRALEPYWLLGNEVVPAPIGGFMTDAYRGERDHALTPRPNGGEPREGTDLLLRRPEVIDSATRAQAVTRQPTLPFGDSAAAPPIDPLDERR